MLDFILDIFYSAIAIYWGYLCIRYRWIVWDWTWWIDFAEKYLWRWWTDLLIILFWLALMFFWVMIPFWWISVMINK